MPLRLYNTLRRNKENFEPIEAGKVKLYVCGVTVYDRCHIGHARANVAFDVIYRYLKYLGYEVRFVRNFTDVDDKIIKRSAERNEPWQELTRRYIEEFTRDMSSLGNLMPDVEPKATEHIPQMIRLIEDLIRKGLAYESGGDVFYKVRAFPSYGQLSQKKIEELESGARVEVMESKTDPLDFALWKSAKPGEPAWDSPWGKGRPGWHIECSAMSMNYLGETFDLHGGGRDLIFPHHENEIAQSEGATGKPFVKYWLHNGFVNINAHKMSKSVGNILSIQEVLEAHDWETVRAFLVSVHYRSPIDFTEENLHEMREALDRFYSTVKRVKDFLEAGAKSSQGDHVPPELAEKVQGLLPSFQEAMNDDFNTAMALGLLFEAVRVMNKALDQHGAVPPSWMPALGRKFLDSCEKVHSVLGCFGTDAEGFFERQKKRGTAQAGIDEATILQSIEDRKQARLAKDFKRADEIRQELLARGVVLKDRPDGTTEWSVKG
ncbi:MAG: cysteine--tRNA ligase [bacterium]